MGLLDIFKKNKSILQTKEHSLNEVSNYSKAVFLNAYRKSTPVMSNSKYYKYLETECNIKKPSEFHKQMISEGYLIEDCNIPNNFLISNKGTDYLIKYNECVKVHNYKKYEISWNDYCVEKKNSPNLTFNEIIWTILDKKFESYCLNKKWGLARSIELYKAQICDSLKNYEQAFLHYVIVFYFDLSGCNNDNYIDSFDTVRNYAPAIQKKLKKYSKYYNDAIINECFTIKLPHHYYNKYSFKEELKKCLN